MEENKQLIKTEEKDIELYTKENIRNMIFEVRGKQVILDSDVAKLYNCETKYMNRVVKRNQERFPTEFCFQLDKIEFQNLRCQFVTSNFKENNYGGRRYLPYVFTEQGIAMLSALIKSEIAIEVSINIMKAFIEMRKFITTNKQVFERLTKVEYKMIEYDKNFENIFNELQKNNKEIINSKIFFEGQIYDAYSLIVKIIKEAKEKILIIDNYIDDSVLEMLAKKNKNVEATIFTSSNNKNLTKLDIEKFNKQYPTLKVGRTSSFHDRFIVIDNEKLYHIGASLKDLGKKCFGINKLEDNEFIENIKRKIKL